MNCRLGAKGRPANRFATKGLLPKHLWRYAEVRKNKNC